MTTAEEAGPVGVPDLSRSHLPDSEARSFLFAFNVLAWQRYRQHLVESVMDGVIPFGESAVEGPRTLPDSTLMSGGLGWAAAASNRRPVYARRRASTERHWTRLLRLVVSVDC